MDIYCQRVLREVSKNDVYDLPPCDIVILLGTLVMLESIFVIILKQMVVHVFHRLSSEYSVCVCVCVTFVRQ